MKVTTSIERAERAAAPEPARIPSGDRPVYPPDEGQTIQRAERAAAPEPAAAGRGPSPGRSTSTAAPSGDRPVYSTDEGQT